MLYVFAKKYNFSTNTEYCTFHGLCHLRRGNIKHCCFISLQTLLFWLYRRKTYECAKRACAQSYLLFYTALRSSRYGKQVNLIDQEFDLVSLRRIFDSNLIYEIQKHLLRLSYNCIKILNTFVRKFCVIQTLLNPLYYYININIGNITVYLKNTGEQNYYSFLIILIIIDQVAKLIKGFIRQ